MFLPFFTLVRALLLKLALKPRKTFIISIEYFYHYLLVHKKAITFLR